MEEKKTVAKMPNDHEENKTVDNALNKKRKSNEGIEYNQLAYNMCIC